LIVKLTNEHIDYIIKDLNYRGVVAEGIEEEMIDHICSATEAEMADGKKFIEVYHSVLKSFGHTNGLREIQKQTLKVENQKATIMLKNYLTIAFRNLRKQSFYSFINIGGLAVGVAACLVIVLFLLDELNYDKYNTKADRIYRVNTEIKFGGNHFKMANSPAPTGNALMQDYPEVESCVRLGSFGSYLVKTEKETENRKENKVGLTDSTFFKIFSVDVLEGDPSKALNEPSSIAISNKIADKYFPGKSAMGQLLILDNKYIGKVMVVFKDISPSSHFHYDILLPLLGDWPGARDAQSNSFLSNNFNTYLLLKEGADSKALEKKFPAFIKKYAGPQLSTALGSEFTIEKYYASGNKFEITLTPILDIHLHSNLESELEPNSSITYVYLLSAIALFILTIACINFMNLATARSSNRAKEVGIRKVMGSLRSHLVRQFLAESTLTTLLAFVIGIGVAYMILPLFNGLALKQLFIPFGNAFFYFTIAIGILSIGLLAGLYPSFFLSSFKPINVLKGNVALGMKSGFIRSALVVFQFVISIFLIIGALSVNRQLTFIQNKKLGFEKNQVIVIKDAYALRPNIQSFKTEALKINSIESCTISGFLPIEGNDVSRNDRAYWKQGNEPTTENLVSLQNWRVDTDYVKTMGMKIKEGRSFSSEFPSDSSAVIINEAAVIQFGLGDNPIGKKISTFEGNGVEESLDPNQTKSWTVIGVVENFHFSSMKESISSLGLFLHRSDGFLSLRTSNTDFQETIVSLEKLWKKLAPGQPFQYSFLDDDFEKMYASEQRLGNIFTVFSGLAIIIACLGLFALTAFTAEQRTKEIGIRKVLGASVTSIVMLLSKEFGKLILIAFVIATPIAWFGVGWWLKSYTYKAEIGVMVYILAGAFAFVIAWITMGYQSIRAANSDPVKSLRSE
jgi:putative ABC transport system permease protein